MDQWTAELVELLQKKKHDGQRHKQIPWTDLAANEEETRKDVLNDINRNRVAIYEPLIWHISG